jgi:uncharacterized protein YjeT (DUF2065 family)
MCPVFFGANFKNGGADMWNELLAAIALVFVLEGILPFAKPEGWRRMIRTLSVMKDQQLRIMGLGSMLLGLGILYLLRG